MSSPDRPRLFSIRPHDVVTIYTDLSDEKQVRRVSRLIEASGRTPALVPVEFHYIPSIDDRNGGEVYGVRAIAQALREVTPKPV